MLGRQLSDNQIIQILHDVETGRLTIDDVCCAYKITENTFNRWLYTHSRKTPTQRVSELQQENLQLKQILAEREQELHAAKELLARFR
jgi:transposase-like protein